MNIDKSPKGIAVAALVVAGLIVIVKLGWMGLQIGLNKVSPGLGDKSRGLLGI